MAAIVKRHIMTAEEIRQKWEYEAQGRPWPPVEENSLLKDQIAQAEKRAKEAEEELEKKKESLKLTTKELKKSLDVLFTKYGVEPAEELIKMALEVYPADHEKMGQFVLDTDQRISIWRDLLQYRMPKLKAMEVSGEIDNNLTVVIRRFGGDTVLERKVSAPTVDIPSEVVQNSPENSGVTLRRF